MFKSVTARTSVFVAALMSGHLMAGPVQASEFEIVAPNDAAVEVADGQISVNLNSSGCDAGFEAACSTTRQRAEYSPAAKHAHGDRVAYRWEVKVGDGMVLNATDKHLYGTRFLAGEKSVLQFYVSNEYGYEVNRKTCFGPEEFGEWHQVEVRVVWDATKKKGLKDKTPGEIHIACDGKEIFSKAGRPNIKPEDEVQLALGLEGSVKLAEGDAVSVAFRNLEIASW